ncbi:MAG: metallophosphoesterase [Spirochaetes bacterium]|nr:metallophosphoesterase [Spirochaetota bacterium]
MIEELKNIQNKIINSYLSRSIPDRDEFLEIVCESNFMLENENNIIRPRDNDFLPGGLINLKKNIPTLLIPDLHGRADFFIDILFCEDYRKKTVLENLYSDKIQIVAMGDGMHGESRAAARWQQAFSEYKTEYRTHDNIDEEMFESLTVMKSIMIIKNNFPENFHYIKGNHDNILNEKGNGNYPFAKYSYEGAMVEYFVRKFYGDIFLREYARFEKNLPLFCVGKNFLVSHAQPQRNFSAEEIIGYRKNPDVVTGMTWTDNGAAETGGVDLMIEFYLKNSKLKNKYYFGGHRPVKNLYNIVQGDNYVQIHNPSKFIIAYLKPESEIDLDNDIIEINNNITEIIKQVNPEMREYGRQGKI